MFIIEPNLNREMKIVLRGVKRLLGHIPPHWEVFATVNAKRFKMFLEEITYLSTHERINPDFFTFLRFYIASKNNFTYCYNFNQAFLVSKGYTLEDLNQLEISMENLPLDKKHQTLFKETITAINKPTNFTSETIVKLKSVGWDDSDIFDAIDHGTFLFKFSKILRAYSL